MGGYGALRNGLKYNDVFGYIVAIAPAIIIDEIAAPRFRPGLPGVSKGFYEYVFGDLETVIGSDVDIFWLTEKLKNDLAPIPDIYFACGSNDKLVFENRRFHNHLADLGVRHVYDEAPGTHDELFFMPHLLAGLSGIELNRTQEPPNPYWIDS